MAEITVHTQSEYTVLVTHGLDRLGAFVRGLARGNKIAVLTDENVHSIYNGALNQSLLDYEVHEIVLPAGERTKCIDEYYGVIRKLAGLGFTRSDTVITFGGGVIGDWVHSLPRRI